MSRKLERLLAKKALLPLFGKEMSPQQIAGHFDVSEKAVRMAMKRHGIEGTGPHKGEPRPNRDRVKADDAAALYRRGMSLVEVANALGCSTATIARRLDSIGVERRDRTPNDPYVYTVPAAEGADKGTVSAWRKRNGKQMPIDHARIMSDDELAAIAARIADGEKLPDIAQKLNLGNRVLWNRLDRWKKYRAGHPI